MPWTKWILVFSLENSPFTLCFLCVQAVSHKLIIVPNMETMRNIIELYIYIHTKKTPTRDTEIPGNFCPLSIPFISHIFLHSPVFSDGSYSCASLKNLRPLGAWKCAVATDQDSIMKQPWPQVKQPIWFGLTIRHAHTPKCRWSSFFLSKLGEIEAQSAIS